MSKEYEQARLDAKKFYEDRIKHLEAELMITKGAADTWKKKYEEVSEELAKITEPQKEMAARCDKMNTLFGMTDKILNSSGELRSIVLPFGQY